MPVLAEVLAVFAGMTLITAAIDGFGHALGGHSHLLVGMLFLFASVRLAQREPGGLRRHGIDLAGLLEAPAQAPAPGLAGWFRDLMVALRQAAPVALRESAIAVGVACLIFPPFAVGFYLWHGPTQAFALQVPVSLGSYIATQLIVVALPEEALFRGYFQTRLGDVWPAKRRLLGALISPRAWLLQAVLFALIHFVIDWHPARLAVFFPALLFGWMRSWRGGIGAALVLHALSNLLSEVLIRSWL